MADTSKFKTAHQLAKELLAGPDHIVVIPTPAFDMPGCYTAFPVRVEVSKVQNSEAVILLPDAECLEPTPPDVKHENEETRSNG